MILTMLQVALGGAMGASLRFASGIAISRLTGPGFPVAVMSVNVFGSFLMGACAVIATEHGLSHWQPFVMTGLLGGFTTFSTFSLETITLFKRGQTNAAALYVVASVTLSLLGLFGGISIVRIFV
ncbi:MAG: fluoride efflux transporter CrcB [Roseobacter sp.]